MRFRFHLPVLLAALAVAAAGCGGSEGGGGAVGADSAAASVVPASAVAYVSANADLESEQWQRVKALADKFPGKDKAVAEILESLSDEGLDWERDVDPALGPEVAVAVLLQGREANPVLLTQPDDEEKLKALATKADESTVTREIDEWWAVAETEADLDLFERAQDDGPLADDDGYRQAVADLPDEALATFYIDGEGLQTALPQYGGNPLGASGRFVWLAGALEALDEGGKLSGSIRVEGPVAALAESYTPELLERVPSGALGVLSFRNLGEGVSQLRSLAFVEEYVPQLERSIGVTLTEIADLLRGEGVLYVRPGAPIPEVSLALSVDDEAKALETLDRIAERIAPLVQGRRGTAEVDGVATRYVEVEGVRITYATFDGILFLTSGPGGLAEFRSDGEKLADDEAFTRTKEAAGLGEETSGFIYVNLRESIGLIQGFAGIAGESIPPDVSANLAPLDTLLVHGARDGEDVDFTGFVGIR